MKIDLIKYMSERLQSECGQIKEAGPVITISREYGCPAKKIAQILTEQLTKKMFIKGADIEWKYITKEIMTESAKELEVDPEKIQHVLNTFKKA
ncbi:MAG: cytidylate kinase-like family protein [Bacteroidales bacterium]|nr:cytidylate kinase-like family protein [Bacteroidales bacterium]